ncbi:MAG: acetyl-CoA carboxylase carboxyltransferase subunit alpha [Limisphaerales bacterium]
MKHHLDFEKPLIELQQKLDELRRAQQSNPLGLQLEDEIQVIGAKLAETRRQIYAKLTAWQRVQLARHPLRPYFLDYARLSFTEFSELHGDRLFADDHAMVCGFAKLGKHRVLLIGTQKGRDTKENIIRNFGSANPEGYRKALRLMRLADRFGLPIISLIDTMGAYPGVGAEERHIAEAIAVNLREMMLFEVPIIAAVLGEGGSGGALGIGVADRVLILENAYYSVISPEGCAAILWKDRKAAALAAAALKITGPDLLEFKLVDGVVPEPDGGAHHDPTTTAANLKSALTRHLEEVLAIPGPERLRQRYQRFRAMGHYAIRAPSKAENETPTAAVGNSATKEPTTPSAESARNQASDPANVSEPRREPDPGPDPAANSAAARDAGGRGSGLASPRPGSSKST